MNTGRRIVERLDRTRWIRADDFQPRVRVACPDQRPHVSGQPHGALDIRRVIHDAAEHDDRVNRW
jgi:hypothetical protein